MFVIAGITGNTGAAAAEALLEKGHKVRALVRDPAKASAFAARGVTIVTGEIADPEVLARAFEGAEGAYLLVPPNMSDNAPLAWYDQVAEAVRSAAIAAKLPRLVFLSSEGAHLSAGNGPIKGLHAAERILKGAAPKLTFLRASYFQENWRSLVPLAQAQGIMPTMLADLDAPHSMIAARDIGRAAAELLLEDNPPAIVELESAGRFSPRDAAAAMSAMLGKPVMPVQPPRDQWEGILIGAGLSPAYAGLLAEMYEGINSGHVGFEGGQTVRKGPTGLAETIGSWGS
jgi:uncharacterized protein YbjT (DUF2867 family)